MLELHITYVTKKSKIISKCIGPWCSINRLYTNKLVHFYPTVDNLWHVCLLVFAPKGGGDLDRMDDHALDNRHRFALSTHIA
jgi:hypothetical protein